MISIGQDDHLHLFQRLRQSAENGLLLSVTDPKGQTAHVFTYDHNPGISTTLRCTNEQCGNPGETLACNWETADAPGGPICRYQVPGQ